MYKNIKILIEEVEISKNIDSPLDQFEIKDLLSIKGEVMSNATLSLTNIGLYLTASMLLVLSYSIITSNREKVIPNN